MTGTTDSEIRAMVAQLDPVLGNVEANRAVVESSLDRTKAHGADLVVFPELFLTGYHINEDPEQLTRDASEAIAHLRPQTEDVIAVIGTPTFDGPDIYNSAVVLENGERIGTYRKTHLFGPETVVFEPGDRFPTFETGVGTLGIQICYDMEFPEVARQLALSGADLLITMLANMRPCRRDQELYHCTRALENGLPHVLCNRIGNERDVDFFGESGIVDRRGRHVLSLGTDCSQVTSASVELHPENENRHDYLGDRRPDRYEL